jgi:hypothetical protein
MNQERRNALLSITFYVIAVLTIIIINVSGKFKSGPCTPNLDLLSFFFLGPLSFILLVINGISKVVMNKQTKYSFIIHLLALIIWIIILSVN